MSKTLRPVLDGRLLPNRSLLASRLFWKAFATFTVLVALSAVGFAWVLSARQSEVVRVQALERLHDSAVVLRSAHGEGLFARTERLQRQIEEIGRANRTRLTLIAEDGTVIADSAEDPSLMGNHRTRPEIQEARRSGEGISERPSSILSAPMLYYALRVGEASPVGYVRAAVPVESLNAQLAAVRSGIWWTAGVISLAGLAMAGLLAAQIARPVERLTQAARDIAAGELEQKVVLHRRDELGVLAEAFNSMSEQLATRIEELKRKGRQLEENSERLQTVLGSMIEGVVAVDETQRILFANKAARTLLDLAGPQVAGRPLWETVRNPTIQEIVRNALAGQGRTSVEFEIPRTQAVVAMLATRLPGEPCPGVLLVLHDVTDLRRLENLRRDFVSNVSHELKTPLTSIQAYTETLLNGAIDDAPHNREFLQRIEEQADRLHALILDLLQLARIESGQDVYEVAAVPLEGPIRASVEAYAAVAAAKNVDLRVEPSDREIRVHADDEGLQTIFSNLVDNAIKYTPAGGRVTVRWHAADGQAVIRVQDTGVGIAPKHQTRIFERFYRVDRARSREMGGTGLGLSIVKHLAQVFGGTVEVESQVGRGSTFSVRLPLA